MRFGKRGPSAPPPPLPIGEYGELRYVDAQLEQGRYEWTQYAKAVATYRQRQRRKRLRRLLYLAVAVALIWWSLWSRVLDVERDRQGNITITSCSPWPSCVRVP